jgi:L-2-hydroxyglutarate oxidase LhgO
MGSTPQRPHVVVVGAGIVGLASARALAHRFRVQVTILEAEKAVAAHQTGHNSGVAHSGLYYKPGSHKARLCVEGRAALQAYCDQHGVAYEACGKLVVATRPEQLTALETLEARGRANGLRGVRRLSGEEICEHEPHAQGLAALLVPDTGIVDYPALARALAAEVSTLGGRVLTSSRVIGLERMRDGLQLHTTAGDVGADGLVGCAGLQSDRLARLAGLDPGVSIVPFRGEYYELVPQRSHLVRNLIYPVPDPAFPFLGVHFTRKIRGGVEAGPNAVLSLARHGYTPMSFSARDVWDIARTPGFWGFAGKHMKTGWMEITRSFSKRRFAAALAELVPEVTEADLLPGGAGVRAQAMDRRGVLVDDFHLVEDDRSLHVLNAPSPAATASLKIGDWIAARIAKRLGLGEQPPR